MNIPTKKMPPRTDTRRVRLRTGESQRANGTYQYRWTTQDGVRHTIYAPTLDKSVEEVTIPLRFPSFGIH